MRIRPQFAQGVNDLLVVRDFNDRIFRAVKAPHGNVFNRLRNRWVSTAGDWHNGRPEIGLRRSHQPRTVAPIDQPVTIRRLGSTR